MPLHGIDLLLWVASLSAEAGLLLILLLRRHFRNFPIFSLLIFTGFVRSAIGLFVKTHLSVTDYQHYYWSAGILDECLQLFVLYEIASHVFAPTGKWAADVRRTILAIACVSATIAALLSLLASPATNSGTQTVVMRSNFFSAVLTSELFVGMVVLSHTVGLPWKTHAARIAQGLGGYSLICIALGIAKMFYGLTTGVHKFDQLNHIRGFAYIGCEVYWIVTLWQTAPAAQELPEAMKIQIYTLQRRVENDLIRIRSWRNN